MVDAMNTNATAPTTDTSCTSTPLPPAFAAPSCAHAHRVPSWGFMAQCIEQSQERADSNVQMPFAWRARRRHWRAAGDAWQARCSHWTATGDLLRIAQIRSQHSSHFRVWACAGYGTSEAEPVRALAASRAQSLPAHSAPPITVATAMTHNTSALASSLLYLPRRHPAR